VEIWKDIKGFEGIYQISNQGRIKALAVRKLRGRFFHNQPEKLLKYKISAKGYCVINLCNNGVKTYPTVHRLVAIHFIPNPENKPTVNHKDGNKLNNNDWNLEWSTQYEQIHHAMENGLQDNRGEKAHLSKLTSEQVIEIKNSNKSRKELALQFNVGYTNIGKIKKGEIWKHI
jgi:hypothetical protein